MRVYISVDMEGIAGVVHEDQTNPLDPRCAAEYQRFRKLMTAEANAAIRGALEGGAGEVLVNDSHWNMRNLLAEELHPGADLLSGDPKPWSMMQGVADGFDLAFFVGYHARARTQHAILDHTYTDLVSEVRLNGTPIGEIGLNARLAGSFGVPVALVTGDRAAAAEAEAEIPGVTTVAVKEAVSRHAARSRSPEAACRMVEAGARHAMSRIPAPLRPVPPYRLEVEFSGTAHADMAELLPGSERTGARTVVWRGEDYRMMFRTWRASYNLAARA